MNDLKTMYFYLVIEVLQGNLYLTQRTEFSKFKVYNDNGELVRTYETKQELFEKTAVKEHNLSYSGKFAGLGKENEIY